MNYGHYDLNKKRHVLPREPAGGVRGRRGGGRLSATGEPGGQVRLHPEPGGPALPTHGRFEVLLELERAGFVRFIAGAPIARRAPFSDGHFSRA